MIRILRHFAAVLVTVAVVVAIGIAINHVSAAPGAGNHVGFRRLPATGPAPNLKLGDRGNVFVGPPTDGGSVDVQVLVNTLTLFLPGIAIVASLAAVARRSRRSKRPA